MRGAGRSSSGGGLYFGATLLRQRRCRREPGRLAGARQGLQAETPSRSVTFSGATWCCPSLRVAAGGSLHWQAARSGFPVQRTAERAGVHLGADDGGSISGVRLYRRQIRPSQVRICRRLRKNQLPGHSRWRTGDRRGSPMSVRAPGPQWLRSVAPDRGSAGVADAGSMTSAPVVAIGCPGSRAGGRRRCRLHDLSLRGCHQLPSPSGCIGPPSGFRPRPARRR